MLAADWFVAAGKGNIMASHNVTRIRIPGAIGPADERSALIQRVVGSSSFSRAPHLRGFLLYVSERLLTGRPNEINEYEIGTAVLGRRATFNPYEDNIVRVQARHLRDKLEQYFETEGKDEPIIVTIPRGSYVPVFEARRPPESTGGLPAPPPQATFDRGFRLAGALALTLVIVLVTAWLVRSPARALISDAGGGRNPFLTRIFRTGDSTRIVTGDAGLMQLEEFLHRLVSLDEYLRADYPQGLSRQPLDPGIQRMLTRDATRPYTSYSDIDTAHRILGLGQSYQAKAVLRHPRHLHIRDFQTGSFVLLGGPLADPWFRLFEDRLNFVLESDLETGKAWFRNRTPRTGEPVVYSPAGGPDGTEFANAALVPNLRGTGNVLLLAGTAAEAAEAAGDMVIREELTGGLREVADRLRDPLDSLEVLVEAHVVDGVPRDSKMVAWRLHRAGAQH